MMFNKEKIDTLQLDKMQVSSSVYRDALIRFKRHKMAMTSLLILGIIILMSIIAPYFSPFAYDYVDWNVAFPSSPSFAGGHIFGTDSNGRDLFVRLMMGVRISIIIGLLASLVSLTIGVLWGSVSGYLGGKTDLIMMRIIDILYAVPFMFLIIILVVVFGKNIYLIFISIGAISWLTMARIVRGQTIS
ncbi:MAG: ABC transporter permease subunit, partial [Alphaproteobacteria bacterium]|nr:ABC transporter permease subunit [Alphaproteobacteria bacterium]